jgi:hypothetical protein
MNIEVAFYHIEKCMGSSFRDILYKYFSKIYTEDEIYWARNKFVNLTNMTDYNVFQNYDNYDKYKLLLCHMNYNENKITDNFSNNHLSIIVIREPIERFISHYYYFNYPNNKIMLNELSEIDLFNLIDDYGNLLTKRISGNTDDYNIAINNIKNINCILIMKNIDKEIVLLNDYLNNKFKKIIKMNNVIINDNKIEEYKKYYKNDYKYLLKYNYKFNDDIKLYNYINNLSIDNRFK